MRQEHRFKRHTICLYALILIFSAYTNLYADTSPLPSIDVTVNGSADFNQVTKTDVVNMTVSLDPQTQAGKVADWWIYAETPSGNYYFNFLNGAWGWSKGLATTYDGVLFTVNKTEILNTSGFLPGTYTFYFIVDLTPNGIKDASSYTASTTIVVTDTNTTNNIGDTTDNTNVTNDFEVTDWTEETHSKSADPNFDEVFDDTLVKRLDIVITEERWQSMIDDMTGLYGDFGASNKDPNGGLTDTDDPIFVPAEVFCNGRQWYRVGVRFKGNSSLQSSWERGILKLPFKLDFDEFEDDYPQIDNQRFYGFKKLSLKNNYEDKSFMREKVAAKIFENAGLAVSHTAFYTLYVDHGNGPEYFGLYTLVEEVDNTVIKTQFSDDDGNLYKPEDTGASFVNGTFNETDFEKKTNEDEEDWSDIIALFAALHDGSRTVDPASWRANLDSIFNTDVFLKYLAVNTVIQNWDTYGKMTQNYYLYNDPDNSKLTWIPWDMNEALQDGKMGGALVLNFSDIQAGDWPLIEYLYADDVYKAKYDGYVEETMNVFFEENAIRAIYANYSTLIEPYATSEIQGYSFLNNKSEFQQAVLELNQHLSSRTSAVANYLY